MQDELNIMLAMQDDEFQEILKNDKKINDLEKLKNDKKTEYFELMAVISKKYFICDIPIIPITPIMWSYLYCIGNSLVTGEQTENIKTDIDVFMFLLAKGLNGIDQNLFEKSKNFCEQNGINYLIAFSEIKEMVNLAFRASEMLENSNSDSEETRFNLDWLTGIVSIVAEQTNKDSDYIMFNMSLTECMYYVIQYARKNSDKPEKFKRKNSTEINGLIYERMIELGQKYYEQKYKG